MIDINKIKKDNTSFQVPEGYFDELQDNVMQKVRQERDREKRRNRYMLISSIAASVALVLGSIWIWLPGESSHSHVLVDNTTSGKEIAGNIPKEDTFRVNRYDLDMKVVEVEKTSMLDHAVPATPVLANAPLSGEKNVIVEDENATCVDIDYQILEHYQDELTFLDVYFEY